MQSLEFPEFIKAHRRKYPIEVMCRTLNVAPSGYYEWLQKPISDRALEDGRLLTLIRASYKASHGIYGAPQCALGFHETSEFLQRFWAVLSPHDLGAIFYSLIHGGR